MKRAARVVLAAAVAVTFGVMRPSASANDCSNPKNPAVAARSTCPATRVESWSATPSGRRALVLAAP